MPDTKARKRLQAWIDEDPKSRTASAIGRLLSLSQPSVSGWLLCKSRPESHMRRAIERLTGGAVRESDWETDDERRFVHSIEPLSETG